MELDKNYYVYILTNTHHTVLYTGVTSDLIGRRSKHKEKYYKGFTARYNCDQLVYFETLGDMHSAIEREKQIKAGSRQKKVDLINAVNSNWDDLYDTLI